MKSIRLYIRTFIFLNFPLNKKKLFEPFGEDGIPYVFKDQVSRNEMALMEKIFKWYIGSTLLLHIKIYIETTYLEN